MRSRSAFAAVVAVLVLNGLTAGEAQRRRLNAVIQLLEEKKPVFGLYAPSNGGGRRGPSTGSGRAA